MEKIVIPKKGTEDAQVWDRLIYVDTESGLNQIITLRDVFASIAYHAHIEGFQSGKYAGLHLSKEERAEQYCREKGLIP